MGLSFDFLTAATFQGNQATLAKPATYLHATAECGSLFCSLNYLLNSLSFSFDNNVTVTFMPIKLI